VVSTRRTIFLTLAILLLSLRQKTHYSKYERVGQSLAYTKGDGLKRQGFVIVFEKDGKLI